MRWPKGPPHLALNPPYLFFCFFLFFFFFLYLLFNRKTLFFPLKRQFLFIYLCFPLFLFSLVWASPFFPFSFIVSFSYFFLPSCFFISLSVSFFSFCSVCFLAQDVVVNFMVASNEHAFWPSGKWLLKRFILVHVRIILMNCLCQGHPSVNVIDYGHCNAHVCVCAHICVFFCTCPAFLILIQIFSPQEAMHLTFE